MILLKTGNAKENLPSLKRRLFNKKCLLLKNSISWVCCPYVQESFSVYVVAHLFLQIRNRGDCFIRRLGLFFGLYDYSPLSTWLRFL